MAKDKFRYNPEKLNYEKITISIKDRLINWGLMFIVSIFISVGYYLVYSHIYDTPKERALTNKLSSIKFNYQILSQDLERIDQILSDIQKRDDDIYRTILESEPIPASIRQAGFGGVNRYEPLEGYQNSNIMIEAAKHTDKVKNQLYVQSISYDELIYKAINMEQMALSRPAIRPIASKHLKTIYPFGWRSRHPIFGDTRAHNGIDLVAEIGTPIYATGNGTVIKAEYNSGGYGRMITIEHGFGFQTRYAHMSSFSVEEGRVLKRGDVIGTVGNTGNSSGPHLHYGVYKDNEPLDPAGFLRIVHMPEIPAYAVED